MDRSFWKNSISVLLVVSLVVLFLAVRAAASWRPRKVLSLRYGGAVIISPDEHLIANASADEHGRVSVRALPNGEELRHRVLHRHVSCLAFSPDEQRLAIAWSKSTAHQFANDTRSIGLSLWELEGQYRNFEMAKGNWVFDKPTQLRFSPDGKTLWMASTDNLRAWDVASGKLRWQWRDSEGRDSSLPFFSAISADCRFNFRSDSDGYSVWHTKTKKRLLRTKLPFLTDSNLKFSPDASAATYYADTPNGIFNRVIDTRTGRLLWQSQAQEEITFIAGKALQQKKNGFDVYDAHSGRFFYELPAYPKNVPLSSLSNHWLYTMSDNRELFRQRLR